MNTSTRLKIKCIYNPVIYIFYVRTIFDHGFGEILAELLQLLTFHQSIHHLQVATVTKFKFLSNSNKLGAISASAGQPAFIRKLAK